MSLLDTTVSDQPEAVATALDQLPVVGDQQHAAREGGNRLGQLLLARQIQVVGGLVEPEHVVAAERQGEKQQSCPLAAAQGVHLLAVADIGKPARISA